VTDDGARVVLLSLGLLLSSWSIPLASQPTTTWSVSPEPDVEFGVVDGDPDYTFGKVRAARFLPDGRIVVADEDRPSIRVYGVDGEFRAEMGGEGEGPGEFESIFGMWVRGPDTIRVWDNRTLRVTTFLGDGSLVGTREVRPDARSAPHGVLDVPAGEFSDGDVALAWTVGNLSGSGGYHADRIVFGRFGPKGELKHLLGEGRGLLRSRSPVLFTPYPYATVHQDSVYFTDGVGGRIIVLGPAGGGVARTLKLPASGTDASEAWSALETELRDDGEEATLRMLRSRPRAERTPALGGLLVDDRGFVWAKIYDPTSDPIYLDARPWGGGGTWWVATPEGEPVARVPMPDRVAPLDIEGDRLLGLRRGPLDAAQIVVHTLDRGR
jgi:hypothetical protein